MAEGLSDTQRAADRAARNTWTRAAGEIVGKLASLVLVFVLARKVGTEGVGVYVFALAWAELTITPVDMGFDRYLLRRVARHHDTAHGLLFNVLVTKLLRAGPVFAVSFVLVVLLDYDGVTQQAVALAVFAVLFNSLTWTLLSYFNAHERGTLGAVTIVAQRVLTAGLGLAALAAGYEVVAVMIAFLAGNAFAFGVALVLAHRHIGLPRVELSRSARRDLRKESWPFAGQELLSIGITRVDTVMLSLLATTSVVGLYGAGYRLFEATLFIPTAITAAFAAMFTYLERDSDPALGAVFQRALKLTLFLLLPIGTAFLVLAEPICTLLFGDAFAASAGPLRLLAPTAVLLGIVLVTTTFVVSRTDPRRVSRVFVIALVVNVVANLALIPSLEAEGAALAMLITEATFAVVVLRMAAREVDTLSASKTCLAPCVAAAVMAAPMLLLDAWLVLAVAAGAVTYLAAYVAVERLAAPGDLAFMGDMVRRRLPRRPREAAGGAGL